MPRWKLLGLLLGSLLFSFSPSATAHPLHGASSFIEGMLHPLLGLDHVLAAVAIGFWAVYQGGRERWLLPVTFVLVMSLGMGLAGAGLSFWATESLIAASLLVLGLVVARGARWPAGISVLMVSAFALLHGYAHGLEMPAQSPWFTYAVGITLATGVLHVLGFALGATRRLVYGHSLAVAMVGAGAWRFIFT